MPAAVAVGLAPAGGGIPRLAADFVDGDDQGFVPIPVDREDDAPGPARVDRRAAERIVVVPHAYDGPGRNILYGAFVLDFRHVIYHLILLEVDIDDVEKIVAGRVLHRGAVEPGQRVVGRDVEFGDEVARAVQGREKGHKFDTLEGFDAERTEREALDGGRFFFLELSVAVGVEMPDEPGPEDLVLNVNDIAVTAGREGEFLRADLSSSGAEKSRAGVLLIELQTLRRGLECVILQRPGEPDGIPGRGSEDESARIHPGGRQFCNEGVGPACPFCLYRAEFRHSETLRGGNVIPAGGQQPREGQNQYESPERHREAKIVNSSINYKKRLV